MRVKGKPPKGTVKTKVCDMSGAGDFKSGDSKTFSISSNALSARPDAKAKKTLGGFLFPLRLDCGFGDRRGVSAQNFGKRLNRKLPGLRFGFLSPPFRAKNSARRSGRISAFLRGCKSALSIVSEISVE